MTYSLNTLNSASSNSDAATSAPTGVARFASEIALVAGFVLLVLWLIALFTYSPQDLAWSTSGARAATLNKAGRLGAWVADVSYFVLGLFGVVVCGR